MSRRPAHRSLAIAAASIALSLIPAGIAAAQADHTTPHSGAPTAPAKPEQAPPTTRPKPAKPTVTAPPTTRPPVFTKAPGGGNNPLRVTRGARWS